MRKRVKEAAQLYGLHSMDLDDLLKVCESISEAREAITYAEEFGKQYDFWCECQYKKHQEIEKAWKEWYTNKDYYMTVDEIYSMLDDTPEWYWDEDKSWLDVIEDDYTKAEIERGSHQYYTEQELQDAFDTFSNGRIKQIARIGREAHNKGISCSSKIINRFFTEYNLTGPEITAFWVAYYAASI